MQVADITDEVVCSWSGIWPLVFDPCSVGGFLDVLCLFVGRVQEAMG